MTRILANKSSLWTICLFIGMISTCLGQDELIAANEDLLYFEKGVAIYQQSLDSAILYFKQGIPYYEEKEDWMKYVNCHNAIGTCNYYNNNYQEAFKYFHLAIKETNKLLGQNNMAYTSALNNLGRFHNDFGEYNEALKHYKEAIIIEEELGNREEQVTLNNNIGLCLMNRGDIDEALQYYKKSLRVQKAIQDGKPINFASCYYSLGTALKAQNKLDIAFDTLHKALQFYNKAANRNGQIASKRIISCYWTLAEIALQLQKEKEFNAYTKKAQSLEKKHLGELTTKGYNFLGAAALEQQQNTTARSSFQKALSIQLKTFKGFDHHPEIGKTHCLIANSYFNENDFSKSAKHYQLALNNFTKDSLEGHFSKPSNLSHLIIDLDLLKILHGKAKSFCAIAKNNVKHKKQYIDEAEATFDLAIQAINHLRKDYFSTTSKEALAQASASIYEDALKCIFYKYHNTPNELLFEKALQLVESGKAAILLESINENTSKGFAGIPDSLIQKENELKRSISNFQQRLYNLQKAESLNPKQIEFLEGKLFNAKNEHQVLLANLESTFADYHQLKYNQQLITLKEIKHQLPDNHAAFIEYFVASDFLYIFYITKKESRLHRLEFNESLDQPVEVLRDFLHQPPNSQNALSDFNLFTKNSTALFTKLIQPIGIAKDINRLMIIPDDVLGYIPFEVLLQESASSSEVNYSPTHLNYLLNDFTISYHYSATLWKQRPRNTSGKDFLGFAPTFKTISKANIVLRNCEEEDLYQLKCNEAEILAIKNIMGGKALTNTKANAAYFLKKAGDYKILHFATHSCLNDENPMLNKIYFTDDYINNYDLYNLKLNAELAVLSACNTGNGPLLKGEGVMSIFRGFLHAGCPSSLISFWSVEDCTTQGIMESYYHQLKAGKAKDEALHYAKNTFLQSADRLHAHPFYWAPFVQFGNIEALAFTTPFTSIPKGLFYGLLIIVIGVFLRYHHKRNKKSTWI